MVLQRLLGIALVGGSLCFQGAASAADAERETLAAREHIAERVGVSLEDVAIHHLGLAEGLECGDAATFTVDSSPGEDFKGSADLRVSGFEGDELCGSARVRARVEVWRRVAVVTKGVPAGSLVEYSQDRVSIDQIGGVPVGEGSGPWEARVDLRQGQPLTQNLVRSIPDARSGDVVTIEAGTSGLRVEASGRLLESARLGETVRVSNLATDQVVRGVLVGPKTVRAGG
jgi:flagella basal body P-ring formation protein FlgA